MATTLPVPYTTLIDGFSKGVDSAGPFYKCIYKIDNWSDSDNFCNAIMGFGKATGSGGSITVTRGVPHQYPLSPNLYAQSAVVIEGLGNPVLNSNGFPNYDGGALIQVEYRPAPWNFGPGGGISDLNNQIDPSTPINWCTQELDFGTETYTIDGHNFTFTSGPAGVINTTPGIPGKFSVPITYLNLTFHKLPYLPMTAVRAGRGCVNSTTFLGSAAGLVLFKGASTHREWNDDGSVVQEVKMSFVERPSWAPWNSMPSKTSLTWYPVADLAGPTKLYNTYDLNLLLFS